jgi:hypothetical protein
LSARLPLYSAHGAAMESNHPSGGLLRPAGFEDRMGHQTPAAPKTMLEPVLRRRIGSASVPEKRRSQP